MTVSRGMEYFGVGYLLWRWFWKTFGFGGLQGWSSFNDIMHFTGHWP